MMCPAQIADATSDLQQLRAEMTQLSGNVTVVTQRASCECWHSACMRCERAAQGIWAAASGRQKALHFICTQIDCAGLSASKQSISWSI